MLTTVGEMPGTMRIDADIIIIITITGSRLNVTLWTAKHRESVTLCQCPEQDLGIRHHTACIVNTTSATNIVFIKVTSPQDHADFITPEEVCANSQQNKQNSNKTSTNRTLDSRRTNAAAMKAPQK